MNENASDVLYLCARCLLPGDAPGPCPRCGQARLTCRPGDPDDPCRRPLIDAAGQVRTRAPLWWLKQTVAPLMGHLHLPSRQDTPFGTAGTV